MTVEARLPDGTTLRFPAGTPDDAVDAAVARHLSGRAADAEGRRQNSGPLGYVDSVVRQVAQGATFGGMDEASAALRTGAGLWGDYGQTLEAERARDRTFAQDNPIASTVANIGGGFLGPGLAIRGAQAGAGIMSRLLRSAPVRGAVAGAVGGGATGFGDGEGDLASRAQGALEGGAVGAGAGAALGTGLNIAGRIGGRVLDVAGLRNPDTASARQVLRAFERDGVDPATVAQRLQTAPPHTILPDVAGRNTVNLAAVAANTPGRAQEVADTVTQVRRAGAPDRIAEAVDANLGGGGGTRVADEVDALRTQRTAQARPLYDQAFQAQAPDTPALREILDLPVVQRAMASSEANQRMGNAGSGQPFQMNPMQRLDAAKRGLDEQIAATLDPVTNRVIPGRGEENIALTQLRARLIQELDAVPEYAQARAAWAGPTSAMQAMDEGQRALRMNRDAVATVAGRQTGGNEDFFRLGAGRAITDMTSDPARAPGAARRLVEDRQMQARLEAIQPDAARRNALIEALNREVQTATVDRAVSPRAGSQTGRLAAGADDMAIDPPGGVLMGMLQAGTQGGAGGMAARAGMGLYRRTQGINPSTADALAGRLFNMDPAQNAAEMARLQGLQRADMARAALQREFMARMLRGVGTATAMENQSP